MVKIGHVLGDVFNAGVKASKDAARLVDVPKNVHVHLGNFKTKFKNVDKSDVDLDKPNKPDTPNGQPRNENGQYATNPDRDIDSTYDRPSGWRAGMRDDTWNDAAVDGVVVDPETGDVLDPNEPWVMGHAPGHEFRHHQRSAQERGITREQFLDEYYNHTQYRPESPGTSSRGTHELDWEDYVGPGSPFV